MVSNLSSFFQGNAENLQRLTTIAMIITGMVPINVNRNTAGMNGYLSFLWPNLLINSFRVTDEKYLQWQCKKTCDLCNVDPSRKEMDQMCDALIPQSVKQKYKRQPKKSKTKSPSKQKNIKSKPLSFNGIVKVPEKDKSSGSRTVTIEYFDKTKNKIVNKTQDLSTPGKSSAIEYFDKKENKVLLKTQNSSSRKTSALPFTSLSADKSSRVSSKSAKAKSSKKAQSSTKSKSTSKNTSKTSKKSSGGFIVINDPERRRKLRSFWMRAG